MSGTEIAVKVVNGGLVCRQHVALVARRGWGGCRGWGGRRS